MVKLNTNLVAVSLLASLLPNPKSFLILAGLEARELVAKPSDRCEAADRGAFERAASSGGRLLRLAWGRGA